MHKAFMCLFWVQLAAFFIVSTETKFKLLHPFEDRDFSQISHCFSTNMQKVYHVCNISQVQHIEKIVNKNYTSQSKAKSERTKKKVTNFTQN